MEADPVRRMFARGGRPEPARTPPQLTVIDALALRARPHLCEERGWTVEEVEAFLNRARKAGQRRASMASGAP
jgi:hypothetical protein